MERKEKIRSYILSKEYVPLTFEELCAVLDVPAEDRGELESILASLIDEMQIIKTKKGRFAPSPDASKTACGVLRCNGRGFFGFVQPETDEYGGDIFIHGKNLGLAYDGDTVLVRIDDYSDEGRRAEGSVIKVLKRGNDTLTGVVTKKKNGVYRVKCDSEKIFTNIHVNEEDLCGAQLDERVVVSITGYDADNSMLGKVIKVLGDSNSIKGNIEAIIYENGIKQEFDEETLKNAESIPAEVSEKDIKGRVDLRGETIFTIDGDDARDFDDAVSIEKLDNGNYRLGVHIADVTNYVTEGSPLDREAFERATSVYLADRVIPMLPLSLSNGICSLNPHVDRLTLTVFMEINDSGNVVSHELCKSVIRSVERMTYNNVTKLLDGDKGEVYTNFGYLLPTLEMMRTLAEILHTKRERRGSINFDFPESAVAVNDMGEPIAISKIERQVSHKIIEEFMLAANETVAEYAYWSEIPFVYRIHEPPGMDKLEEFNKFIYNFGLRIKGTFSDDEPIHPMEFNRIMEQIKGRPEERIISTYMLRSLMKARYSPQNAGHFGLAAKYYTHFTSPIRRYPDLAIHRILKEFIDGRLDSERANHFRGFAAHASEVSSDKEIGAENAERDVDDLMKAVYMSQFIGEAFDATVSSITNFGVFAELDNSVEGLIRLENMKDDYYLYDDKLRRLMGEKTGQVYKIGDRINVTLVRTDILSRQIDFVLTKDAESGIEKAVETVAKLRRGKGKMASDMRRGVKRGVKKGKKKTAGKKKGKRKR